MKRLSQIITSSEDWLMSRVLGYAKERGYTLYTSTLVEAWRLSISGLSESILEAIAHYSDIPELSPDEDFTHDPVGRFGIMEAQRHRERGVSLSMFLGLMKYYRQAYLDLLDYREIPSPEKERYALFIDRTFDRVEIAFCTEWAGGDSESAMQELQAKNRLMTNEKNKYLTIFESIPLPVIIFNAANAVDNMNLAAAKFFHGQAIAGSRYYSRPKHKPATGEPGAREPEADSGAALAGEAGLFDLLAWIKKEIPHYNQKKKGTFYVEKEVDFFDEKKVIGIRTTQDLDVSEKFSGLIMIFEDLTPRKNEQRILIEQERLQAALETVGMVYHELGQPLQVIMGMAELMLLDSEVTPEQNTQLDKIIAAARNLSNIVRKLDKITTYTTKGYMGTSSILDLDKSVKDDQ